MLGLDFGFESTKGGWATSAALGAIQRISDFSAVLCYILTLLLSLASVFLPARTSKSVSSPGLKEKLI